MRPLCRCVLTRRGRARPRTSPQHSARQPEQIEAPQSASPPRTLAASTQGTLRNMLTVLYGYIGHGLCGG